MDDNTGIYFCDLCGTSVPERDLETGSATRVKGRVVGSCCVAEMHQTTAAPPPPASAPPPATPAVAPAMPTASAVVAPRRSGGGAGLLGATVVVLAAVAGATVFLDWRLSDEASALTSAQQELRGAIEEQRDRLRSLESQQQGALRSSDLEALRGSVTSLGSQVTEGEARVRASVQAADGRIQALRRGVDDLASAHKRHASALDRVTRELGHVGEEIAALAAMPQAAPANFGEEDPPLPVFATPSAPSGLSAELAHHVTKLKDPDPGIRFEAVDKLVQSKDPAVLSSLVGVVNDADPFVRRLTVQGLAEFRSRESVEALLVSLGDQEPIVRHAAVGALRSLTGQNIAFDPDGRNDERRAAQRKWQDWWKKNRDSFPL